MKVVGIIAEYNPMHNGHLYHIQKSKEITGSDYVIVIMSGSFTQSGNIAIYDKFTRSKIATTYGADLVIELPTIFATASAPYFALGAISILDQLKIVDTICFGSECDNITLLGAVSDILIQKETEIIHNTNQYLKTGISYAEARAKALSKYLSDEQISILSAPNNILGLEYLKVIKMLKSKIEPYMVKRESSDFNEIFLNQNSNNFTSATSIRNSIQNNKIELLHKYVPQQTFQIIKNTNATFNESIYQLLKYTIIFMNKEQLAKISGVTEGLENKIIKEINQSKNYDEFSKNVKSKRYQLSRIKRMLTHLLLHITKDDFNEIVTSQNHYAHILSCSEKGKELLSEIARKSSIPLLTSVNQRVLCSLPDDIRKSLNFDILASNIHSIINNEKIQKDYTNQL